MFDTTACAFDISTFGASQWRFVTRVFWRGTSRSIITRRAFPVGVVVFAGTFMVGGCAVSRHFVSLEFFEGDE